MTGRTADWIEKIERLESVSDARKIWPGIVDLNEVYDGGNPDFWERRFPGTAPAAALCEWDRIGDWTGFWRRVAPYDCMIVYSRGAREDMEEREKRQEDALEATEFTFYSASEAVSDAFRWTVAGLLDADSPSFALAIGRGVILYWPFKERP